MKFLFVPILLMSSIAVNAQRYDGVWASVDVYPTSSKVHKVQFTTSSTKFKIQADSFYVTQRVSADFRTEDPCTKWPTNLYFKGKLKIKPHTISLDGFATDSTFSRSVKKCMGKDPYLSSYSIFSTSGDTIFFNFPYFTMNYESNPIALVPESSLINKDKAPHE